jgi:hypothetical protein
MLKASVTNMRYKLPLRKLSSPHKERNVCLLVTALCCVLTSLILTSCANRPIGLLITTGPMIRSGDDPTCAGAKLMFDGLRPDPTDERPLVVPKSTFDILSQFWGSEGLAATIISLSTGEKEFLVVNRTSLEAEQPRRVTAYGINEILLALGVDLLRRRTFAPDAAANQDELSQLFLRYAAQQEIHNYVPVVYAADSVESQIVYRASSDDERILQIGVDASLDYLFKPRVSYWHFTGSEAAAWLRRRMYQDYVRLDVVDGKIPDPYHRILRQQTIRVAGQIHSEMLNRLVRQTIAEDRQSLDRDFVSNVRSVETPTTNFGISAEVPTGVEFGFLREIQIQPDETPCALTWTKAGAFVDAQKSLFEAVRWRSAQFGRELDGPPNINFGTHALAN